MLNRKQLETILQKTATRLLKKLGGTRYGAIRLRKAVCEKDKYTGYYCAITNSDPVIGLPEFFLWIDNSTDATRIWAGFQFSGKTRQKKFVHKTHQALKLISSRLYGSKKCVNGRWVIGIDELTQPFLEAYHSHNEYYFGQFDSAIIEKLSDTSGAVEMALRLLDRVFVVLQMQALGAASNQRDDGDSQKSARDVRRGQPKFRKNLLAAYGGKCAISGCQIEPLLDAAHVKPHSKRGDHAPSNGILLRADLHTLFDEHLLNINPDNLHVELADEIRQSEYKTFHGSTVSPPIFPGAMISLKNLRERYATAKPLRKKG